MRILFLIDQLEFIGGGERVLLRMIRHLPRDRFRCQVASFRPDLHPSVARELDCPFHVFPLRRTWDWNAVRMAVRLAQFIRSERIDIVQTFFETADLWGGLVARMAGCPVLISSQRDLGFKRSRLHRFGYRVAGRIFDQFQTVSGQVRESCLRQTGASPERVVTVYNGIDPSPDPSAGEIRRLRDELGLDPGQRVVVNVANVWRVKGHDVLIRAARPVCDAVPGTVFLIAGGLHDTRYRAELEASIAALGLEENVRFLGPRDDIRGLLALADCFVMLSHSEGFSNAVLEAMAARLPCVVTRVGGNPEAITDGEDGFLVPPNDPEAAASRLIEVLKNPNRARRTGDAARQTVERRFTIDAMIETLVRNYESLARTSRNGA